MPQISVVIPTYNREVFIEGTIRSVLSQTLKEFEIVVVDDGSHDDTVRLVTSLAREDLRVRLLQHGKNLGAQAARNTGIRAAKARWVAFLDSDDLWLPESLELRWQLADQTGLQVVHSDCYIRIAGRTDVETFHVPAMQGNIYSSLLEQPGPVFPSLLVTKQALASIGYLDAAITSYQEWDTSIRLAKCYEFAFLPQPTFIYDCRHDASISKDPLRAAIGYEQVFTKHKWAILLHLGPRALASHYQIAAGFYQEANTRTEARRCLRKALGLWPFNAKALIGRAQSR